MTDKLPIITGTRAINATVTPSNSLIGRGLSAMQHKEIGIVRSELDARYRQSRDIYNRITGYYDWERRSIFMQGDLFENDLLQKLADIFTVFQQLAAQGYGKAYFPLAKMYEGEEGISENIEKSSYYSRLAFNYCFTNRTLEDSEIWRDLGWMYYNGFGIEQDNKQAVFWYCKAAYQGDGVEQFNLGCRYKDGHGVEQDDEQAVFWWKKAAEQGLANAQFNLGFIYQYGKARDRNGCRVVGRDREQAIFWYRKAAEQGQADAQFNLGWLYEHGRGVEQDEEQAIFWYRKAVEQGHAIPEYTTNLSINWKDA